MLVGCLSTLKTRMGGLRRQTEEAGGAASGRQKAFKVIKSGCEKENFILKGVEREGGMKGRQCSASGICIVKIWQRISPGV